MNPGLPEERRQGLVGELMDARRADIRAVVATVESVGDYDCSNVQHHGTPAGRRDAWVAGFRGGDPSSCAR